MVVLWACAKPWLYCGFVLAGPQQSSSLDLKVIDDHLAVQAIIRSYQVLPAVSTGMGNMLNPAVLVETAGFLAERSLVSSSSLSASFPSPMT